jgi:hypothetical protein
MTRDEVRPHDEGTAGRRQWPPRGRRVDAAGEQPAKRDIESHGTRDSNNDSKDSPLPIEGRRRRSETVE